MYWNILKLIYEFKIIEKKNFLDYRIKATWSVCSVLIYNLIATMLEYFLTLFTLIELYLWIWLACPCSDLTRVSILELICNWYILLRFIMFGIEIVVYNIYSLFTGALQEILLHCGEKVLLVDIIIYGEKSFKVCFNDVRIFQTYWNSHTSKGCISRCLL